MQVVDYGQETTVHRSIEDSSRALKVQQDNTTCKLLAVYSVNSQLGTMGRPFFITVHKARCLLNR